MYIRLNIQESHGLSKSRLLSETGTNPNRTLDTGVQSKSLSKYPLFTVVNIVVAS